MTRIGLARKQIRGKAGVGQRGEQATGALHGQVALSQPRQGFDQVERGRGQGWLALHAPVKGAGNATEALGVIAPLGVAAGQRFNDPACGE